MFDFIEKLDNPKEFEGRICLAFDGEGWHRAELLKYLEPNAFAVFFLDSKALAWAEKVKDFEDNDTDTEGV